MTRDQTRSLNRIVEARTVRVDQKQALIDLLERSLQFGHRRLAIRRYFMLQICGHEVPAELGAACEDIRGRVKAAEVSRIQRSVCEWHQMLRRPPVSEPESHARLETVWR
jgi:hypothetical protein